MSRGRPAGVLLIWAAVLQLVCGCAGGAPSGSAPGPTRVDAGATWGGLRPAVTATAHPPRGTQPFQVVPTDVGRLVQTTLTGQRSGVTLRVWVWLPPQYDDPAHAHDAFPALMLYPGGAGVGHNAWAGTSLGAREFVAARAASGTVLPFVFVMPEMQLSTNLDTECADLPGQPKVGTFLSLDVRAMVVDNFRVSPDRVAWGAAGTSSGAYCAMRLVFDHPDQYCAVVSIDGYFAIDTPLAAGQDPAVRAGDPEQIAQADPPAVSVLIWSGNSGHDLAKARHFLARVRAPTNAQLRNLPGGQHLTIDMARMVPDALLFLSDRIAKPGPVDG